MTTIELLLFCYTRASAVFYWCVNAINCTGKNTSRNLLGALGEADANMYLCSKRVRPGKETFLSLSH